MKTKQLLSTTAIAGTLLLSGLHAPQAKAESNINGSNAVDIIQQVDKQHGNQPDLIRYGQPKDHGDYYEVIVGGELDVYTVPELEEVLVPMRQEGTHDIHVNLANVSYMDSTGLGLFVGTLKALNQNGKDLYILGVSDRIGRLFDITGLKDLMHVNEGTEVE